MSNLVDPAAVYDTLPPETQRQLGVIAIALGLSAIYEDDRIPDRFAEGVTESHNALDSTISDCIPGVEALLERPVDLNRIGFRMCTSCGCTDNFGCDDGCTWAGATLCSRCDGPDHDGMGRGGV